LISWSVFPFSFEGEPGHRRGRPQQKSIGSAAVAGSDFLGLLATSIWNRPAATDLGIKKMAFKGVSQNFLRRPAGASNDRFSEQLGR